MALNRNPTGGGSSAVNPYPFTGNNAPNLAGDECAGGMVTSMTTTTSGTSQIYLYAYDNAGRLQTQTMNGTATAFTYLADGELASEKVGANAATTYTYDSAGNRTADSNSSFTNVIGAGNVLQADNNFNYYYDADGNMTGMVSKQGQLSWNITVDPSGQDVGFTATSGTDTITYAYDAYNNRINRNETLNGTNTNLQFEMSAWDSGKPKPIANENFDAWSDVTAGNAVQTRRLYGASFNSPQAAIAGTTVTFYVTDHQGTIDAIQNASKGLNWNQIPTAYGVYTGALEPDVMGFQGMRSDFSVGLDLSATRPYNPRTGRFIAEDTLRYATGDANWNRAQGNSPNNGAGDPSGWEEPHKTRRMFEAPEEPPTRDWSTLMTLDRNGKEQRKRLKEELIHTTDPILQNIIIDQIKNTPIYFDESRGKGKEADSSPPLPGDERFGWGAYLTGPGDRTDKQKAGEQKQVHEKSATKDELAKPLVLQNKIETVVPGRTSNLLERHIGDLFNALLFGDSDPTAYSTGDPTAQMHAATSALQMGLPDLVKYPGGTNKMLGRDTTFQQFGEMLRQAVDPFAPNIRNDSVGQPGFLESGIPIWGSGRAAYDDYQNKRFVGFMINLALTIPGLHLLRLGKLAYKVKAADGLTHWTTKEAYDAIKAGAPQALGKSTGRGTYALPRESWSWGSKWRSIATGLGSNSSKAIDIPEAAASAFRKFIPIGPYTLWKWLGRTFYTPKNGAINLETGAFKAFAKQPKIGPAMLAYGVDALSYLGLSVYLGLEEMAREPKQQNPSTSPKGIQTQPNLQTQIKNQQNGGN